MATGLRADRLGKIAERMQVSRERWRRIEEIAGHNIAMRTSTIIRDCVLVTVPHRPDEIAHLALGESPSIDWDEVERRTSKAGSGVTWYEIGAACLPDFPAPLTNRSRVWVSGAGSLFHRYEDCPVMWAGKIEAYEKGLHVHAVTSMTLEEARKHPGFRGRGLWPCDHEPCVFPPGDRSMYVVD